MSVKGKILMKWRTHTSPAVLFVSLSVLTKAVTLVHPSGDGVRKVLPMF